MDLKILRNITKKLIGNFNPLQFPLHMQISLTNFLTAYYISRFLKERPIFNNVFLNLMFSAGIITPILSAAISNILSSDQDAQNSIFERNCWILTSSLVGSSLALSELKAPDFIKFFVRFYKEKFDVNLSC